MLLDELTRNRASRSSAWARGSTDRRLPARRRLMSSRVGEFERARIQERVRAGLARVRAQGRRLGRKPCAVSDERFAAVASLSTRHAAERLGVSHTVVARWRAVNKTRLEAIAETPVFPASA